MPFVQVPGSSSGSNGGNFPDDMRQFFNKCGRGYYCGSLRFADASHAQRLVPIFYDECLEDKPETYRLLKNVRRGMKLPSDVFVIVESGSARSIHQNENGYLPYRDDGKVDPLFMHSPAIRRTAKALGSLPHNQASSGATTRGDFLEYTCGDEMHVSGRLIVDYRFGFVYMTFGHYHADSFALLVRSDAELNFEVLPTLPELGVTYVL